MTHRTQSSNSTTALSYANQLNRVGCHFHADIVQEARACISGPPEQPARVPDGVPEPIPRSQRVYHAQADAVLRDLFPRIPNTDRQRILERAFTFVSDVPRFPPAHVERLTCLPRVRPFEARSLLDSVTIFLCLAAPSLRSLPTSGTAILGMISCSRRRTTSTHEKLSKHSASTSSSSGEETKRLAETSSMRF